MILQDLHCLQRSYNVDIGALHFTSIPISTFSEAFVRVLPA